MRPPLFSVVVGAAAVLPFASCRLSQGPGNVGATSGAVCKAPVEESGWQGGFGRFQRVKTSGSAMPPGAVGMNRERYAHLDENPFVHVSDSPRSTFSVDVDTAAYSNVRRMIQAGQEVPKGAVRVEEMINYFDYDYPSPRGDAPFSVADEVGVCPWRPKHRLVRIALQGRKVDRGARKRANLVILVDVSGSMAAANKLPLLKESLSLLVKELEPEDRIAIVTYAGAAGTALPSTTCSRSGDILAALEKLNANGSTAGGEGIRLAYDIARRHHVPGGVNRVILATDGDFNIGITSDSELTDLIEEQATSGVELSVLGFGMGNLNDSMLEKLSGHGNGNYAYIDTLAEAKKVLVEQRDGSLVTIAKDVKLQVEFNSSRVRAYRLIGYENRTLAARDFADDRKDAGEIGAGHQVTALYEVVPTGVRFGPSGLQDLRYQRVEASPTEAANSNELATVKICHKPPGSNRSLLHAHPVADADTDFQRTSDDFRFASSVAAFGMLLKDSEHAGSADRMNVLAWARSGSAGTRAATVPSLSTWCGNRAGRRGYLASALAYP